MTNTRQLSQPPAPAPDAPRRCFICLTDQDPSDPPDSWVDPCPCTLEAHQDCMLSWVTDCERSNKPLQCPVCKSTIQLEGIWDPIVAFSDAVGRRFTKASPFVLFTGASLGLQFSVQMYGALAMWVFSGHDALMEFILGPEMVIDGRAPRAITFSRVGNAAILLNIAPALLIGQLLPGLGNKISVPTASVFGIYHILHNDHFLSWPPSPQLAMTAFTYLRAMYFNMWREFVQPYEVNLNRQIQGLPPIDLNPREADAGENQNRNNGGIVAFVNNILDVLDPEVDDEVEIDVVDQVQGPQNNVPAGQAAEEAEAEVVFELVIGGDDEETDGEVPELVPLGGGQQPAAPAAEAAPAADARQQENERHEAPPPPVRRPGIGTILSGVSNSIVSALILPGISFVMGEALRLLLPRSWTDASRSWFYRPRPGLLQQQWGRSLVGGCLYVLLKDAVRLYSKSRRVASMTNRRVKNVPRRRRDR